VTGPRAIVVPHPPLLLEQLTGPGARDAEPLRAACDAAVGALLAARHQELLLIGPGERTRRHDHRAWGSFGGFGGLGAPVDAPRAAAGAPSGRPAGPPGLPLSLTVGAYLLDRAGAHPPAAFQEVAVRAGADDAARLGAELAARHPRAGVLVLADGTTKRTQRAPGAFDPRAEDFDAQVRAAFEDGAPGRLLALDPDLATELGAAGRSAWQVLAGIWSARGRPDSRPHVDYDGAPYGVGYLVVRWC
jgi:hypothetical protein